MIVELSIATRLPFESLANLEGEILDTYIDVLAKRNRKG